ncbi:hypothetical protein PR202_ga30684 [Eleusine coracana subsp. coracana]|uniref:Jacalin-type lectin domain-containing protein n=1 Tax=Eleusine coracana subsp. coracana TaxID=191504 RepID=A0AAV5DPY9_ELECO|nr:hypothetical protein PR202_ga30684 [Eleusine coracana subsp. coracana]
MDPQMPLDPLVLTLYRFVIIIEKGTLNGIEIAVKKLFPDPRHDDEALEAFVLEYWKNKTQATIGCTWDETSVVKVKKCIKIAMRCVETNRTERPTTGEILNDLKELDVQILFGPYEFVEEVSGAYGSHFNDVLVMSLTFVTNIKTYGPFGNPYHQNVPSTPFRFRADEDSSITAFHGRSGRHRYSIGVYTCLSNKPTVTRPAPGQIRFGPSESLEEVSGAYGTHFDDVLVTSLTFVTNIRTYGPFGNPNHQNVASTPFRKGNRQPVQRDDNASGLLVAWSIPAEARGLGKKTLPDIVPVVRRLTPPPPRMEKTPDSMGRSCTAPRCGYAVVPAGSVLLGDTNITPNSNKIILEQALVSAGSSYAARPPASRRLNQNCARMRAFSRPYDGWMRRKRETEAESSLLGSAPFG